MYAVSGDHGRALAVGGACEMYPMSSSLVQVRFMPELDAVWISVLPKEPGSSHLLFCDP